MEKFKLPINDPRIQSLTDEQCDLMAMMELVANPKLLREMENKVFDSEYDQAEKNAEDDAKRELGEETGDTPRTKLDDPEEWTEV